jgi:3-oxoacyl-[acyl-carrier protein] reductase
LTDVDENFSILTGKRYLVGGASRGLGFAVARELVDRGARVTITSRSEASLDQALTQLGPSADRVAADLGDPAQVAELTGAVTAGGPLDGVVINAGGPPGGTALAMTDEQWLAAFQSLLLGPVRLLRQLRSQLRPGAGVVFITSSSVRQAIPQLDLSNVLRPAVAALVKALSKELGPDVRVNAVAPGKINTDRVRELDQGRASRAGVTLAEQQQQTFNLTALGRYGEPSELAKTIVFLLSPEASYVTGSLLVVDGGLTTALP